METEHVVIAFRNTIFLLVLAIIIACASKSGRKINYREVKNIEKGATTREEVRRMFGRPQQTGVLSDGKTFETFMYFTARNKPQNFVPIVGAVSGGMNMEQEILQISFNEDGIVQDFVYTDSPSEIKTGIAP